MISILSRGKIDKIFILNAKEPKVTEKKNLFGYFREAQKRYVFNSACFPKNSFLNLKSTIVYFFCHVIPFEIDSRFKRKKGTVEKKRFFFSKSKQTTQKVFSKMFQKGFVTCCSFIYHLSF